MSFRDASAGQLQEWLSVHTLVGVDLFILHDDHSRHFTDDVAHLLAPHLNHGTVVMVPPTSYPFFDATFVSPQLNLSAKFVGQIEFLTRCVETAVARSAAWLINLDLDEVALPQPVHSSLVQALEAAARESPSLCCLSVRRHNFYTTDEVRELTAAPEAIETTVRADGASHTTSPWWTRILRAPYPPTPSSGQPWLPKWVLRVQPAGASQSRTCPHHLIFNQHAVYQDAIGRCAERCAGAGWPISGAHEHHSPPWQGWAPHDVLGLARFMNGSGGDDGAAWTLAHLQLLANVLSPLTGTCHLPKGLHCGLSSFATWPSASPLQGLDRCMADSKAPCWQSACLSGDQAERHVRLHHYGHPPAAGQRHAWNLSRAGRAVRDGTILPFLTRARAIETLA